jgi:hypothetical protein
LDLRKPGSLPAQSRSLGHIVIPPRNALLGIWHAS